MDYGTLHYVYAFLGALKTNPIFIVWLALMVLSVPVAYFVQASGKIKNYIWDEHTVQGFLKAMLCNLLVFAVFMTPLTYREHKELSSIKGVMNHEWVSHFCAGYTGCEKVAHFEISDDDLLAIYFATR